MRDDFTADTKRALALRVAHRGCWCEAITSGPQRDDSRRTVNVGVAAHITGASAGGPRYDPLLTAAQRQDIANGIWLCQTCAKLVDDDPTRFPSNRLRAWKVEAEYRTRESVGRTAGGHRGWPRVEIELPQPINPVGYMGGAAFYPEWRVRIRLITEGDRPVDVVELGVIEDGVGAWPIDEMFREGAGVRVNFPVRLQPSEEFVIRARSPQAFATKPTSFRRLTIWCRDHTQGEGERHEFAIDQPPVG